MSAELQLRQRTAEAAGRSHGFYFTSGDHRLFGWLHRSADEHGEMGVVLCQPFGYEAICAHRGTRAFAEAIAAAGMPALRFDYLGTGDSPDIEPQADQLEVWTQDVLAAVEELKSQTGVRHVCLLGFRLGALLAARAAVQSSSVSALAVVSPIVSGRRYLKELRMTRMAASLGLNPSEEQAEKQNDLAGGMEVSGFAFSAASLAALGKTDVEALEPSLPPMLVIEGAASSGEGGLMLEREVHGRTTRVALPGAVEMLMTAPQFAQVPKQMIAATLEWLSRLGGEISAAPDRSAGRMFGGFNDGSASQELSLPGTASNPQLTRTEKPVFFGADGLLFGIVTQPPANEIRRRAVILLNAGADHHIGASRLYVSMARHWAQHGYVVLRMDFGGVGDSGTRPGRTDDDVFPPEAVEDIRAAIEFLRGNYGVRDVTLAGLCSGAYHALRAAVAGLPVNRILMVNPQNYFWKPGETLQGLQLAEVVHNPGVYRERIFSLAAWKRFLTGKVNLLRIVKIYLQRPLLAAESAIRDLSRRFGIRLPYDLGSELEAVVARGIRVVFVFARDEPGIELLKLQAGNSVRRLGERCRIHILDSGDHVFTRSGPRAKMEKIVSEELFARPERLEPPSSNLSAAGYKA